MAKFHVIGFSIFLACHHFKKHNNSSIKDYNSQLSDDLTLKQKYEILRQMKIKKLL